MSGPKTPPEPVDLSVVVPVYRNAETLAELAARVAAAAHAAGLAHELILVDDASPDDSLAIARALAAEHPEVLVENLAVNLGQEGAVQRGLALAHGRWVVTMDADLQDPPEAIPALVARAREGYAAVFAGRRGSYEGRGRLLTSRLAKSLMHVITGVPCDAGMFILLSRAMVDAVRARPAGRPTLITRIAFAGLPITSLPVARAPRSSGRSAYGPLRRLQLGVGRIADALAWRVRLSGPRLLRGLAAAAAVVGGLTGVRLLAGHGQPFGLSDEGFMYLLSRAWAAGENLYESFSLLYQTGQYAYLGSVMRLVGDGVAGMRLGLALLAGLGAAAVAVAVRWAGGPRWLAGVAAVAVAVVDPGLPQTFAMAVLFLAAAAAARQERPARRHALASAAVAGALLPWREDAALIAAVLVAVVACRRRRVDVLWIVPAGFLLGLAPWLALAAGRGELGSFAAHAQARFRLLGARAVAPDDYYSPWRPPRLDMSPRQLFSSALPALLLLPPLTYLALLAREAASWLRRRPLRRATVAAALVGVAYLPYLLWERPDVYHWRFHLPLLVAVVSVAAAQGGRRLRRACGVGLAALALAAAVAVQIQYASQNAALYPTSEGRRIGARVAFGPPPWAGLPAAEGETLIVLPWGPGWYVVENPQRGTRIMFAGPKHLADAARRRELLADLQRPTNRWVITDDSFSGYAGDDLRAGAAAAVRDTYIEVQQWQGWRLWERRSRRP